MAFEFKLPDIGEGLTEGEVTKWLVQEGETVRADQPMVEVMTDKATVEITSPRAGVIEKILVPDGTKVPVGTVIVTITESGGGAAPAAKPGAAKPAAAQAPAGQAAAPAAKAPAPAAAPSRAPAPAPARQAPTPATAARPAPAPAAAPARSAGGQGARAPAPSSARASAPRTGPGRAEREDIQTSFAGGAAARAPAATVDAPPRREAPPRRQASAPAAGPAPSEGDGEARPGRPVLAAPATRALAREHGIDLRSVAGSGPNGRVTRSDLEALISGGGVAVEEEPAAEEATDGEAEGAEAPARAPARREAEGDEHVPFTGVRGKIAEQMSRSKQHSPHFTFADECDVTDLVALREQAKKIADERGVKLTFLPFVMKALVAAMRRYPTVNSLVDEDDGGFTIRREYHFGIATDTPQGLMVPVVRDVDRRTILEVAAELERLTTAARSKKIALQDIKGSTFTITSAGSIGGILATPILNYPEVGILGVYKIADRAVVRDGEIVVRKTMNLSITLDHRVVDGATAAYFLNEVIRYLETPNLLLLEGI